MAPPSSPEHRILCLDIEAQHGATWNSAGYDGRMFLGMAARFVDEEQMRYLRPLSDAHEMASFLEDTVLQPGVVILAHNGKYDLPGINGECMRLGLDKLPELPLVDTCNHIGNNGAMFSKSLENLAGHFGITAKGSISRREWEDMYRSVNLWDKPCWAKLREYNENDVEVTILLHAAETEAGWLTGRSKVWRP